MFTFIDRQAKFDYLYYINVKVWDSHSYFRARQSTDILTD